MFDPLPRGTLTSIANDNCAVRATLSYKTPLIYVDLLQLITKPAPNTSPTFVLWRRHKYEEVYLRARD